MKNALRVGGLIGVVLVASVPNRSADALALDVLRTPVAEDCTLYCVDGPDHGCNVGQHYAYVNSFIADSKGVPHDGDCLAGSCEELHNPEGCLPIIGGEELVDRAALEALRIAVLNEDPEQLSDLVSAYPTQLTINWDRSAVQVLSCRRQVRAHLPLTAAFVSSLASLRPN